MGCACDVACVGGLALPWPRGEIGDIEDSLRVVLEPSVAEQLVPAEYWSVYRRAVSRRVSRFGMSASVSAEMELSCLPELRRKRTNLGEIV